MDPQDARQQLNIFVDTLPDSVFIPLRDKGIDPGLLTTDITSAYELVIRETGNIVEGVRRVLSGVDSPSNLVAFIQKDERIEEDNRSKIPALAYEIQTKIFDPVLPILKGAGFPIKEGRVAPSGKSEIRNPKSEGEGIVSPNTTTPQATPISAISPSLSELNAKRYPQSTTIPLNALDEKNIRALTRIAAGTTYTEDDLRNAFEELPVGLRQSLSSVDTANALQGIAKKHLLHVDQMASLASETGLVLLGLTHPGSFIGNIARRLRLPENQTKEIARDISAEILAKVRDALRGLHEENPKSEIRNPKQILNSNTPKRPDSDKLSATRPNVPGSVQYGRESYPAAGGLNASLQTPYSAGAKWNTGDNILAKQAAMKQEGPLSRAEVLRGIENPTPLNANRYPPPGGLNASPVGPTGWKPQQSAISPPGGGERLAVSNKKMEETAPTISEFSTSLGRGTGDRELNAKRSTLNASLQSEVAFPPPKPKAEPQDFLDQKLEVPMGIPKEEKSYTTDPYREPLA